MAAPLKVTRAKAIVEISNILNTFFSEVHSSLPKYLSSRNVSSGESLGRNRKTRRGNILCIIRCKSSHHQWGEHPRFPHKELHFPPYSHADPVGFGHIRRGHASKGVWPCSGFSFSWRPPFQCLIGGRMGKRIFVVSLITGYSVGHGTEMKRNHNFCILTLVRWIK